MFKRIKFSLSTLILLLLVFATALGWRVDRRRIEQDRERDQNLIELVRRGVAVGFDSEGNPVKATLDVSNGDTELKCLSSLATIQEVSLEYGYCVSDDGISSLMELPNLKLLTLKRNEWSTLARLSDRPKTGASATESDVSDDCLRHVCRMESLDELYLLDDSFTDAGLIHLARMKNLSRLKITSKSITLEMRELLRESLPNTTIFLYDQDTVDSDWLRQFE